MDAIPLITDDDPSESSSSSSPPVDMSIPGAFASKMCCADEKCNGRDCTDDPISDPPPSKRARTGFQLPPNIIEADNANMTLPAGSRPKNTASGNTSIPRVLEQPPHPVKESEKFKTHVGLTVCYCGIHTHSFTCKKPPKGFHGCRMCYGRALSNGTRPIELFASASDGVIQWDELDPCDKPLAFEDYDRHDADGWVSAIDPDRHTCKRNLYHLGDDCSRTIIWELDRPVEEPLQPELANDMTKDEIISSLYQQMFQRESNVGFTGDGCRKFKEDRVDYHIFHRRDNNHLFYSLLLGLVETEQVSPGDKSIEGLRRDLMHHLDGKRCDDVISTTTQTTVIRDYIEPRVAQSDIDMDEQLKLYSQLMKSATGDQCFGGGELEIHLFSEVTGVNVAVYDKTKGELRRVELIGGNANRPTIHLLRETTKSESVGPKSGNNNATGAISPPKHHYTLFTPRFKGAMDKLQTFDVKHLRLLYNTVSDSLRGRNAWVVDFNPLLTSLLGCNSNLLHLGSTEQSKAALFYIGPYINKDGLKITDALPILLKAREHTLNFPSIADDADTNKRHVQHTLTRTLNKMNNLVEVSDTQGASSLLGMGASLCSDLFVTCDVSAIGKFVGYDLRRLPHNKEAMYANEDGLEVDTKEKGESAGGEDEEEEEKQYYDETDILSGDIEDMFGCHSEDGGGDGGDSEDGSLDSDQTGEDKEASSGVAYSADDFQVTEEEDDVDLEMAQRMSGTCSNDESSGLESDEQMSASCNHDGGDSLCDTEDGNETRYQTGNITNKTSDTQYEDCNVLDRDSRRQIARNRRKHHLNQIEDNEEDMIVDDNDETLDFKHINASCGVTPLYRSNDGMSKIPVSYAALYRYRGRELAWMPRYLYYACVRVEISDTGKCSKAVQFGEGLGIEKRYHQVLRFKQCTLRFTGSPPVLPEKMPEGEESDEGYRRKRRLWEKKANRFGMFYLLMFRAEDTLYEKGQLNTYKYDYDAFKEFYRGLLCSRKKYDCLILRQMKTCIFSWRVDKERREMLADFRGRKKTMWSDEEKEAAKSYFGKHKSMQGVTDDGMDYISPAGVRHMSTKQLTDAMKHIGHSRALIDTLDNLFGTSDEGGVSPTRRDNRKIRSQTIQPFHASLDQAKRNSSKVAYNEEELDAKIQVPNKYRKIPNLDKKVDKYIKAQKLSPDKDIVIQLAREHYKAIRSGEAEDRDYIAPLLFVSGKPGNGKSKIIETLDGIVKIMGVGEQMKCAYMGSAAVNIHGTTLLKPWNIPVFGETDERKIRPWDLTKLRDLKRRYGNNIYDMCGVVVDEVSTTQPYMLACLSARMQELFQVFDKPFGGRKVILVGDFDQKPPTAGGKGNTLPGIMMKYIEEEGTIPGDTEEAEKLGLAGMGGYLFSTFRHIELTSQHRSGDPRHTSVINKMSRTGRVSVKDLKDNYKALSAEDMASDDFRFATIIVTGNDERRQINARQARRWAEYHGVNVVRWARVRDESKWRGKPRTEECVTHVMQNSCFWEHYIHGAKGYLNTYGINAEEGLANGTEIKYHSLSFTDRDQRRQFREKLKRARPGDVIGIDSPPTAINVELFPDFPGDSTATTAAKKAERRLWLRSGKGSITRDGRVVIPISLADGNKIKYKTTYVPGCTNEANLWYGVSQVDLKDHFPIEPAFSITVDKAQGKTIHRIVLSISEHSHHLNKIKWEDLYVALSRVRHGEHMRLLIKGGDWGTLGYLDDLKRNEYTGWFFRGYEDHPSKDGSKVWNFEKARKGAGLDGKKKFGSKKSRGKRKRKSDFGQVTPIRGEIGEDGKKVFRL